MIKCFLQVWKGQGSRKWRHGQQDGFFVQFETPFVRKLWFIPSSNELGQTLCRSLSLSQTHTVMQMQYFHEKVHYTFSSSVED